MSDDLTQLLNRTERALHRAGVRRWEIAADVLLSTAVEAMDGKIHVVERSYERTLGIRVIEGGLGFAGLTEPGDDRAIEEAVEAARAEARRSRAAAIGEFARTIGASDSASALAAERGLDFEDARATGTLREILEPSALELEVLAL